jgi:hypothetical protein
MPFGTAALPSVAHFVGYFENREGQPVSARLEAAADDEVAVTINGQTIIESLSWKPRRKYRETVLLPPGLNEIPQILAPW